MKRNPDNDWLALIGIVLVFFIVMLVVAGCAHNEGCDLEVHRSWKCPTDGTVTIVVPGGGG
jgi:hypothetical protein